MNKNLALIISLLVCLNSFTQVLINGGLEGPASSIIPPNGWEVVPHTDPNCESSYQFGATPDVTTATGPQASNGINGNPHGGLSFVSGLYLGSSEGITHHEGIKQTVSGFTPNEEYRISFWQTVIKQQSSDCLDTTGSWGFYLDDNLVAVVPMSHSLLPPASLNHVWDYREVFFTATSADHVLKFLPADDDTNHIDQPGNMGGALRMGIDDVELILAASAGLDEPVTNTLKISPSPTNGEFQLSVKDGMSIQHVTVTNYLGIVIDYRELNSATVKMDLTGNAVGIYLVVVMYEGGKTITSRIQKL